MTNYRVYTLSAAGRILAASWIEASDDVEAVAMAHGLCNPQVPAVEVWCGARRVATLDCDSPEPPIVT